MRFTLLSVSLILNSFLSSFSYAESHSSWPQYPSTLPQFDYSGEKLEQHWTQLAAATGMPWPDELFIKTMMNKFPQLTQQLKARAQSDNAPEALRQILNNNYQPLALSIQQVWRLHYQGNYEQAYQLGMSLSPAGLFPAIYAKLIHTTYLVNDPKKKEENFLEVDQILSEILPLANHYDFIIFGDAYQKARRLELMSTSAATTSGLLGQTQDKLKKLHADFPDNPLYPAMLAGIDAGIIERVGQFIGGITYGADEDRAIQLFQQAIETQPNLAILYNEFAQTVLRLDDNTHNKLLLDLLEQCTKLTVYNAEEALNQESCRNLSARKNAILPK
jgi:hypothetical protein